MGAGMNVSACLVTDGKHDMQPVLDSLPDEWEIVIWNNGEPSITLPRGNPKRSQEWADNIDPSPLADLSVYGRYAAIEYASHDLIYVQDDDVIVSDPQEIAEEWWHIAADRDLAAGQVSDEESDPLFVVCNMPEEFRHDGYKDSALVGFGACFHRDAPQRAFQRFLHSLYSVPTGSMEGERPSMYRECDTVFTMLTPRVLVDIPKQDREFASDPDRLWKQPGHAGQRERMRQLVRQVRDT